MKRHLASLALALVFTISGYSQTDTLFRFLNLAYEPVKDARSAFYKTFSLFSHLSESDWLLADYDFKTGKILQRVHYKDGSAKMANGPAEAYFPSGKRFYSGNYSDGLKYGVWRAWHENGQIKDSTTYGEGGKIIGTQLRWHENGHLEDSVVYATDGSGNGVARSWYSDGTTSGQGTTRNGMKHGVWKYYRPDGTMTTEETMMNDSLIAIRCFNPDGSISTKACIGERDAEFPGGIKKWSSYISEKMTNHADRIIKKGGSGMCVILFIVGTEGKVIDARVVEPSGTYLDKEALDIINNSPAWIPAIQHNRPVKAYRRQPIDFQVSE
jgi:TonB family protein